MLQCLYIGQCYSFFKLHKKTNKRSFSRLYNQYHLISSRWSFIIIVKQYVVTVLLIL